MNVLIKLATLASLLLSLPRPSSASMIPAAIVRRHTVTYKDVPMPEKTVQTPIVYVPETRSNVFVHFKTKSSHINVKHQHRTRPGKVQHSIYEEQPHYLRHEVTKPVIQTIREVLIPYRQVVQEIKPVVEEVKTVVATGVPHSSAQLAFGDRVPKHQYGYTLTTNHGSQQEYSTAQDYTPESELSKPNAYDLSSIYGINPSVQQINEFVPSAKPVDHNNDQRLVYEGPIVYGLTADLQHSRPEDEREYGYAVNTADQKQAQPVLYLTRPEQYDNQQNYNSGDNNNYQNGNGGNVPVVKYEPAYNLQDQPEVNNYVEQGYYDNSGRYWAYDTGYQNRYVEPGYSSSSSYSGNASGDLATSDGSEQNPSLLSMLGPYNDIHIGKETTLADLAQLMSSLSMSYNFEPLRVTKPSSNSYH